MRHELAPRLVDRYRRFLCASVRRADIFCRVDGHFQQLDLNAFGLDETHRSAIRISRRSVVTEVVVGS
jgi:hypothetical protein